ACHPDRHRPGVCPRPAQPQPLDGDAAAGLAGAVRLALCPRPGFLRRLLDTAAPVPRCTPAVGGTEAGRMHCAPRRVCSREGLVLRVGVANGGGVGVGVGAMTTVYEVLTTMAAGPLLAIVVFALLAPPGLDWDTLFRLCTFQDPGAVTFDRGTLLLFALLVL